MTVKIKNATISFVNDLFVPGKYGEYAAHAIIAPDHPQIQEIKDAMKAAAIQKWGGEGAKIYATLELADRLALKDGNKVTWDGYAGKMYIKGKRPGDGPPPTVLDQGKRPLTQKDGKIYSGARVNFHVSFYGSSHPTGGKRVSCNLTGVQLVSDGVRLSGSGPSSLNEFDEVEETAGGVGDSSSEFE